MLDVGVLFLILYIVGLLVWFFITGSYYSDTPKYQTKDRKHFARLTLASPLWPFILTFWFFKWWWQLIGDAVGEDFIRRIRCLAGYRGGVFK